MWAGSRGQSGRSLPRRACQTAPLEECGPGWVGGGGGGGGGMAESNIHVIEIYDMSVYLHTDTHMTIT